MKLAKKIASALRILGWVSIALAVVMSIYAAANDGSCWNSLSATLRANEVNTNVFTRIRFDHQFFNALSDAADSKNLQSGLREQRARVFYDEWAEQLAKAQDDRIAANTDAFFAAFDESFDAGAYLEFYAQQENSEDTRLLKDAFEYLDGLAKPAKSGKKIKLQAASCEKDAAAYYEAFAQEKGEAAGTYLEFVETVVSMVKEDIAAGASVTDARKYIQALDADRYVVALAAVQAQERTATEDLMDEFAALAQQRATGEDADFRGFFQAKYDALVARYPNEDVARMDVFTETFYRLLNDSGFDGSVNTLMKAVRTAKTEADASGYGVALAKLAQDTVKKSDDSNAIGAVTLLWALAANVPVLWIVGIVLIALAKVLDKVVNRITLNRLEHAGIEEEPDVLLRVNHLKQYFRSGEYINKAVDDVSFYIKRGEVFGLVGESGCGKTTTGRTIINLYDPTEGDVYFQGLRISSTQNGLPVLIQSLHNEYEETKRAMKEDLREKLANEPQRKAELTKETNEKLKAMRKAMKQKIRQARTNALESSVEKSKCVEKYREKRKAELTAQYNEDMKTLSGEAAQERKERYELDMKVAAKDNIMTKMQMIFQDPIASINPRMTVREIIAEGLKIRGIKDEKYIDEKVYEVLDLVGLVREHADRYPHEFSGGQRQRIGIARAIVLQPDLIIADEPISALDVSIQAQVINLLNDLRNKMGLTIMFIAHNLSVVKYFSDRIGVMYYGKLVELATSDELFEHPLHPYTKSLLSAIPYPDPHHEKHRKRIEYNPRKVHDYRVDKPTLREIRPGHFVQCNDAEFEAYKKELGI